MNYVLIIKNFSFFLLALLAYGITPLNATIIINFSLNNYRNIDAQGKYYKNE